MSARSAVTRVGNEGDGGESGVGDGDNGATAAEVQRCCRVTCCVRVQCGGPCDVKLDEKTQRSSGGGAQPSLKQSMEVS